MVKSELIEKLAKNDYQLSHLDCAHAVDMVLDDICYHLESNRRVELRGFGVFSMRFLSPRKNKNLRTGEAIYLKGKQLGFFKMSSRLKTRINQDVASA